MKAKHINPILNVSNIEESFTWFEKLGWEKGWDWGDPPVFGAVCSGDCEIFLCQNGQGGRGKGSGKSTFGPDGDDSSDKGSWMSIWVANVDDIFEVCKSEALEIAFPPTDMPWGARKLHVRHPDGHAFRISQKLK